MPATRSPLRAWMQEERKKPYFLSLSERLKSAYREGREIYPQPDDIFRALKLTPWSKLKVVILGQDPYHQPGQANGLAFSVPRGVALPPSLKNIYQLMEQDLPRWRRPDHGDLTPWAQEGVLLLNTTLTVERGRPLSHATWGWQTWSDGLLTALNAHPNRLVFLLWGREAQRKSALLDATHHHLLFAPHPSPLSVYRGFLTSNHFAITDSILASEGREPINWQL